jgi:hypothetical protein
MLLLWLLHQAEIMAMRKGNEFLRQNQYPYFNAVD